MTAGLDHAYGSSKRADLTPDGKRVRLLGLRRHGSYLFQRYALAGHRLNYAERASRSAELSHARSQLVRPPDREAAAEPGENRRHPVERADAHAKHRHPVLVDELRERRRNAPHGFVDGQFEEHLDLPAPGNACERCAHVRDRIEAFGCVDRRLRDRPQAPHAVDPERAEVVAEVVVRGEVPAPRVDDEAMRAELAPRLVARERAVRPPHPASPPDDVGEEEHGVAAHGRAPARTRREVERGLERLDPAPQPVRQHAMDLHERALGRLRRSRQPEPSRGLHPERDGHGFVVREHERRQPVSRPDPVAAADTALPLDRDAEPLQRLDVPPHRPRVDLEPVGDLAAREERLRLEELEELEQPCGRSEHARSQAQIEGRICPICTIGSSTLTTTWRCDVTAAVKERATSRDFDFWMGKWNVRNRRLAQRLAGSDEWDEFESKVAARPLPAGSGTRMCSAPSTAAGS